MSKLKKIIEWAYAVGCYALLAAYGIALVVVWARGPQDLELLSALMFLAAPGIVLLCLLPVAWEWLWEDGPLARRHF